MKTTLTVTTLPGTFLFSQAGLSRPLLLLGTLGLATPLPSMAAMVYGSVTNCTGSIQITGGGQTATVPIQPNGTYQVVVPPGTYQATCINSKQSRSIRSDNSPIKQNLIF
jgi:hypothetical protein